MIGELRHRQRASDLRIRIAVDLHRPQTRSAGSITRHERVIRSILPECTDHIISLRERLLLGVLRDFVGYDNDSRTQLSLDANAPRPRSVEREGGVFAEPVLYGLHHSYRRAA